MSEEREHTQDRGQETTTDEIVLRLTRMEEKMAAVLAENSYLSLEVMTLRREMLSLTPAVETEGDEDSASRLPHPRQHSWNLQQPVTASISSGANGTVLGQVGGPNNLKVDVKHAPGLGFAHVLDSQTGVVSASVVAQVQKTVDAIKDNMKSINAEAAMTERTTVIGEGAMGAIDGDLGGACRRSESIGVATSIGVLPLTYSYTAGGWEGMVKVLREKVLRAVINGSIASASGQAQVSGTTSPAPFVHSAAPFMNTLTAMSPAPGCHIVAAVQGMIDSMQAELKVTPYRDSMTSKYYTVDDNTMIALNKDLNYGLNRGETIGVSTSIGVLPLTIGGSGIRWEGSVCVRYGHLHAFNLGKALKDAQAQHDANSRREATAKEIIAQEQENCRTIPGYTLYGPAGVADSPLVIKRGHGAVQAAICDEVEGIISRARNGSVYVYDVGVKKDVLASLDTCYLGTLSVGHVLYVHTSIGNLQLRCDEAMTHGAVSLSQADLKDWEKHEKARQAKNVGRGHRYA